MIRNFRRGWARYRLRQLALRKQLEAWGVVGGHVR